MIVTHRRRFCEGLGWKETCPQNQNSKVTRRRSNCKQNKNKTKHFLPTGNRRTVEFCFFSPSVGLMSINTLQIYQIPLGIYTTSNRKRIIRTDARLFFLSFVLHGSVKWAKNSDEVKPEQVNQTELWIPKWNWVDNIFIMQPFSICLLAD